MRIAVSADGPDLDALVEQRFGLSAYLVIFDSDTLEVEAVPNQVTIGQRGAGMQAVVLAVSKEIDVLLTGFCSPTALKYLTNNGIKVITGVQGTVAEALEDYNKRNHAADNTEESAGVSLRDALKTAGKQLANLLPIFIGVILLAGLFNAFISKESLSSIFSHNTPLDILWGTGFGSILAGNPISSYIIGGELLKNGVNLFAVTAFITAWVTVGLVQLPAEMAALDKKFALIITVLSIFICMVISILTVTAYNIIVG
ncbi:MAG: hypothetical protein JRD68_05995 [Deltaproteobacteria bacterium]|nr:hypothetical protein [Deltaproteobacteria bacterium]